MCTLLQQSIHLFFFRKRAENKKKEELKKKEDEEKAVRMKRFNLRHQLNIFDRHRHVRLT